MQQIGEDGVNETDRRNQDDEVKLKINSVADIQFLLQMENVSLTEGSLNVSMFQCINASMSQCTNVSMFQC